MYLYIYRLYIYISTCVYIYIYYNNIIRWWYMELDLHDNLAPKGLPSRPTPPVALPASRRPRRALSGASGGVFPVTSMGFRGFSNPKWGYHYEKWWNMGISLSKLWFYQLITEEWLSKLWFHQLIMEEWFGWTITTEPCDLTRNEFFLLEQLCPKRPFHLGELLPSTMDGILGKTMKNHTPSYKWLVVVKLVFPLKNWWFSS